jgi:superfamily II DNA/RNA helicase
MADLGFLPGVRRILSQTPKGSQRLFFSATLDNGINTLVKQFLANPVTHEADSAQSPVSTMEHHVFHLSARDQRVAVLADLAAAPGRTVIFTRTKHGAKALARQLNGKGIPSVDLHGNLSQNARTRNMEAFHAGTATTLVATDIAARGIHVDDVALVVHADPPSEHKAYLHRSGRTARAGASGTVVTIMTDDQVKDVRDLTRAAGIKPLITRIDGAGHPMLLSIAPGERLRPGGFEVAEVAQPARRPAGERDSSRKSRPGSRARKRQAGEGAGAGASTGGSTQGRSGGSRSAAGGSKPAGTRSGGGNRNGGGSGNGGGPRRSGSAQGSRGSSSSTGSGGHSAASFSSR